MAVLEENALYTGQKLLIACPLNEGDAVKNLCRNDWFKHSVQR